MREPWFGATSLLGRNPCNLDHQSLSPLAAPKISGFSGLSPKSKFHAEAAEAGLIVAHITIPPTTEDIIEPDPGVLGAFQKARNAHFCQHLGNHDFSLIPSCPHLYQGRPRQSSIPPIDREISD